MADTPDRFDDEEHDHPVGRAAGSVPAAGRPWMMLAAGASLGAGAVHAAAIGVHAEHRQAALVFVGVALYQLGWGTAAMTLSSPRWHRWLLVAGLGNAGLVAGWVWATTSGISFIDGLDVAADPQAGDTIAALLATISVVTAAAAVVVGPRRREPVRVAPFAAAGVALAALVVPGLAGASNHDHDHDAGGDVAADHDHTADHEHGEGEAPSAPISVDPASPVTTGDHDQDHDHGSVAAVAPVPYDPELPIDLGGVDGVTPQQQARAENLIAVTLLRLPQFSDPAVAEAAGFHSIGDGGTGDEHYVNWDYLHDGRILDPDYPESLVYEIRDGQKTLVSAMYMLEPGSTLETVPDVGGALTQWHIHDNLCFTDDPVAPRVVGITSSGGPCRPPTVALEPVPMIHVWIVPHECGPFAALEGVGAGQVLPGEEHLCDHAHGS
ncbi:MAG: hypothetical protein R2695_06970 [Acidimicrobiales bacterium]